jgi:hypothetical protein
MSEIIKETVRKAREANQQCQFHNSNVPFFECRRKIGRDRFANQCVYCRAIVCGSHYEPLTRLCKACVSQGKHSTEHYDQQIDKIDQLDKAKIEGEAK